MPLPTEKSTMISGNTLVSELYHNYKGTTFQEGRFNHSVQVVIAKYVKMCLTYANHK